MEEATPSVLDVAELTSENEEEVPDEGVSTPLDEEDEEE